MAVDLFEEIIRGYFQSLGYFTIENVYYSRSDAPNVRSDIDLVAMHPTPPAGLARVVAISCKGQHEGLRIQSLLNRTTQAKHPYKEMFQRPWSQGLRSRIKELTHETSFDFCCAVMRFSGNRAQWCNDPRTKRLVGSGTVRILPIDEVMAQMRKGQARVPLHHNATLHKLARLVRAA